jgi:outer membrane protein assembly factor BamB
MTRRGSAGLIILLVVVVLLIVVGAAWFYFAGKSLPAVSLTTTSPAERNAVIASCDQMEMHGQSTSTLLAQTANDNYVATANALSKIHFIESSISLSADGQTFLTSLSSSGTEFYRATTSDILNGDFSLVPLINFPNETKDTDMDIFAYASDTLFYLEQPVNTGLNSGREADIGALNAETGKTLWTFGLIGGDPIAPYFSGSGIYIADELGNPGFIKLDATTGKQMWQFNPGFPPIFDDGNFVYVTDQFGQPNSRHPNLYQLSSATGNLVGTFPLNYVVAGIDECGGDVYLISDNQAGESSAIDYSRFDPQTREIQDLGIVTGS